MHDEGRNVFINRKNSGFISYFVTRPVSSTTASSITMSKQTDISYTVLNSPQVGDLDLPNFAYNEHGANGRDVTCT